MEHAIRIENLDIPKTQADTMVEAFKDILLEIDFNEERIDDIECRWRDGFIPHSHNYGGVIGRAYTSNSGLRGSGYDYGNGIIHKWDTMQNESYKQDFPKEYKYLTRVWKKGGKQTKLFNERQEHYHDYIDGDSDYDSTCFEVRFMVLEDGTVDVDVFGSTMDAPYFRSSDYNEHKNFTFTTMDEFKTEVMNFLDTCDCVDLISECY